MRPLAPVLAVLAVPLLAAIALQQEQRQNEHRLGRVASEIAGRPVSVHCPGLLKRLVDISPNAGTVYFDAEGEPADFTDLDEETVVRGGVGMAVPSGPSMAGPMARR